MSYSFRVKGANKTDAKAAVASEFEKVVALQEVHKASTAMVVGSAAGAIDMLGDDDSKDISVECSGYLCWTGEVVDGVPESVTNVSVSIIAQHVTRGA